MRWKKWIMHNRNDTTDVAAGPVVLEVISNETYEYLERKLPAKKYFGGGAREARRAAELQVRNAIGAGRLTGRARRVPG
jgi:hypothetical protein